MKQDEGTSGKSGRAGRERSERQGAVQLWSRTTGEPDFAATSAVVTIDFRYFTETADKLLQRKQM